MARRAGRSIERHPAFWDASALIPLCVRQSKSAQLDSLYQRYEVVVWWGTPVEMASAIARLVRMKQLDPHTSAQARQVAIALSERWQVIQPTSALRTAACRLVDRYDLRAGDALQLAAALEWCGGTPNGTVFLAADQRLREAAALSGFNAELF